MKYPASQLTPFPPTFPGKITCKKILSAKNSARAPASPLSTFRMNTCESVSKQRTLTPFRMNTCAKTGGGHTLDIVAVQSSGPLNALSPLPPITSLQPLQFHAITHSFAQRRSAKPFRIKRLRTLFIATGGGTPHVPSQDSASKFLPSANDAIFNDHPRASSHERYTTNSAPRTPPLSRNLRPRRKTPRRRRQQPRARLPFRRRRPAHHRARRRPISLRRRRKPTPRFRP